MRHLKYQLLIDTETRQGINLFCGNSKAGGTKRGDETFEDGTSHLISYLLTSLILNPADLL